MYNKSLILKLLTNFLYIYLEQDIIQEVINCGYPGGYVTKSLKAK